EAERLLEEASDLRPEVGGVLVDLPGADQATAGLRRLVQHRQIGAALANAARQREPRLGIDEAAAREPPVGDERQHEGLEGLEDREGLLVALREQDLGPRAQAEGAVEVVQTLGDERAGLSQQQRVEQAE